MRGWMLWTLAVVITLASAVWQRTTGPTYPQRIDMELAGAQVRGELITSHSVSGDLPVVLEAPADVRGEVLWRRLGTDDDWTRVEMVRADGALSAHLPAQPSAGKLEYHVLLARGEAVLQVNGDEAVVARFKGDVPAWALVPHIFFMFFGMLWSNRCGLEAMVGGPRRRAMALTTLGLLVVGGLILGPIVQKYAFGAYWTGWPFGEDLTDNKLAVAVLAWVVAAVPRAGKRGLRLATVVAALVVFAVYMIPHSLHGSTLDYETMETISG